MISLQSARLRARVISAIRRFFDDGGYLEVDTPLMAPALIPEPYIEVFETEQWYPHANPQETAPRYLIPSPEIWMKELLATGFGNIYQLGHCFRNGEIPGPLHCAEFTMLEWYTVGADYENSADTIDALLGHLVSTLGDVLPAQALRACSPPALRLTVADAFKRYAGIAPDEMAELDEDAFQQLFLTHVEEAIPSDRPVILTDYPQAVPTLAEQKSGTPYAQRWELYLRGMEIANCYSEERDRHRLLAYLESAARAKRLARVSHVAAMGLVEFERAPECSGVALGVDRLLMALIGARDIRDVIFSSSFGIFREPKDFRGKQ